MRKKAGRSRRQRSLFELDQASLPFDDYMEPPPPPAPWLGEQLPLFEGKPPLLGAIRDALLVGDLDEVRAIRARLIEVYGMDDEVARLGCLDELGQGFWLQPLTLSRRLAHWGVIRGQLIEERFWLRVIRQGFFERLLRIQPAQEVLREAPDCACDLIAALYDLGRGGEARRAVRDALLLGVELSPLDFDDHAVSELLAEDRAPQWLASLGAIHYLWPRPRPSADKIKAFEQEASGPLPQEDTDRALSFWRALCVAQLGSSIPEDVLHRARKRMKQLDPDLHGEYMS